MESVILCVIDSCSLEGNKKGLFVEYETDLLFYDISIIPGQTRLVGFQFQKEWVPLPAVKVMQYRARINLLW